MEFNNKENRLASFWFVGAGIFAICLSLFIYNVDLIITYSDGEKVRGREMKELRTAQASLTSNIQDPRIAIANQ